jgi:hypothetical protein
VDISGGDGCNDDCGTDDDDDDDDENDGNGRTPHR